MWGTDQLPRIMARREPKNYLRTYRKRSGLAQGDVSYLVKARTKGEWSRYERSLRQPSLRTAFACEKALGVPVTRLFAGLRESVGDETIERMQRLESRLKTTGNTMNPARRLARKLQWLGQLRSAYPSYFSSMKKCKSLTRILALDLHPGRFGYVVLEDATELLDWGVRRNYRGTKSWRTVLIQKRLSSLLNQWEPSLVLMNEVTKFAPQIRRIVTVIRKEARRRRLMVKLIGRAAVNGTFGKGRPIRKYEIASLLAECFPVLHWELPPKRKIWESEHYRMCIFDAAALAMSCLKP